MIKLRPSLLQGFAVVLGVAALVISVIALFSSSGPDSEEIHLVDRGEFTVDLVMDALELYEEEGLEATLAYYNSPDSMQGEWYVFVFDEDDKLIAHANQDLLGMDLKGDLGVDSTGYRYGDVMLGATEQGRWVDYVFLNPATGDQEYKHSWVVRKDGLLFGSGWYQILPALPVQSAEESKMLTMIYWQAPSIPNPYLSGGYKDRDAGAITLEPLAKYDPDGALVPALAAEIPTLQNGGISSDLTSITWKLKGGLRWSDGSSLTAHDVVFTWRYCIDEGTGCTASSAFTDVISVEALDDLTVRITFHASTPYPYTPFVGTGVPVLSRAQFVDCVGVAAADCEEENYAPLGSGPYRIVQFTPDQLAIYERNPHYHGEMPYFDDVVLKGGGDALSAAEAVLESGKADYAWNLQIAPETLARMEAEGHGKAVSAFSSLVERIVLNQTNPDSSLGEGRSEYLNGANPHPFLTFTPIARAMSMALDRTLISEKLYGSSGEPACNLIVGPPSYVSAGNEGCLVQDIEGANRLLADNGVLDTDDDGVREYNGVPLRMTFQTSTNDIRQETQLLVKGWWQEIGIEAEIVHHDAAVFFGGDPVADKDRVYSRFFADVQMYATGPGIDPQEYLFGLTCAEVADRDNNWSGGNVARACNAEFDELVEELSHTSIGPDRAALVKRMNDILVQSYYEIPLVNRGIVSAHLHTLRGVRINGWDSELWNIAEWRR